MSTEPRQGALPLHIVDKGDFVTFVCGDNSGLVDSLKTAVEHRNNDFFYVFGQSGCGKSHLLSALAHLVDSPSANCFFLDLKIAVRLSPQILSFDLPQVTLLDNIDAVAGSDEWELALFGVFNRWIDSGRGLLVMTASASFDVLRFNRHDLNTRLGSGIVCQLQNLDEKGCAEALKIRARERGIVFSPQAASFLVRHSNRDMHALMHLLDELDVASLEAKHEVTVPFIKKILRL